MQNKYAVVFPGQGSQTIGMLKELAVEYPLVRDTFYEASTVLDYDLWDLAQNGPEEKLNRTEFTQPALLAAGVAVWRVWCSKNQTKPSFLAGHSLGEYTALVCSEAIAFKTAIKLVQARGRFMKNAYHGEGAMVAIVGLDDYRINEVCDSARQNDVLVVANYNSIGQTVLAGDLAAANRAIEIAKNLGAKIAKILPVSIPSHCLLMKSVAEKLAELLQQTVIALPKIPVIHNASVVYYNDPQKIRDVLIRQIYSPVHWVAIIQFIVKSGVKYILECGPGKVLTGLNKRINGEIIVDFIGEPQKILNYLTN
ncbi:MAG: ACP S-malonyltransferase [Coxiellaceae bacterium]|jgi:[acyl-carrier-protein] S-malonyltransferase|nr:ACP S-malonyltransferase [Coxiellaceae bacterium]